MLGKTKGRTIIKFVVIWTLIAAIFTAAYSTGLYMIHKDGMRSIKAETVAYTNAWCHSYSKTKDIIFLDLSFTANNSDYAYFGKIEDDGSLTDVYKTDYDSFELQSSDAMFLRNEYSEQKFVRYYLTTDTEKQGKVVTSSHETAREKPALQSLEQHYLLCPEEVLNKIRKSQSKGTFNLKQYIPREGLYSNSFYGYPENDLFNKIFRAFGSFSVFISDHLIHILDDFSVYEYDNVEDYSDGAYINRADVDIEAGKILSGELCVNGEKYVFPDGNLTDSNTKLKIILHKRPDSIFEKNKDLLRDKFDPAYLESLQYQSMAEIKKFYGEDWQDKSGLERFAYDYKYEDGHAIVSGICKYDDGYYRYVYIFPLAGFWESFAPWIAEPIVLVWIPGLIIGCVVSLFISRKRYS